MTSDKRGQELHDRLTRGVSLTPAEQAELDAWYQRLDQEERTLLTHGPQQAATAPLRTQFDAAMADLQAVLQRIREIEAENESLKGQIVTCLNC